MVGLGFFGVLSALSTINFNTERPFFLIDYWLTITELPMVLIVFYSYVITTSCGVSFKI